MMIKQKQFLMSLLLLATLIMCPKANAENDYIPYVTYFPPPIDSFDQLKLQPINPPASCPAGTAYVDKSDNNLLKICNDEDVGNAPSNIWIRNTFGNVHPVDLTSYVALGALTANSALQIDFDATNSISGTDAFGGLHLKQAGLNSGDYVGITSGTSPNNIDLGMYFIGKDPGGTEIRFIDSDDLTSRGLMTIKPNGYVGVGTSTPLQNVHFLTSANTNISNHGLFFQNNNSGTSTTSGLRFIREATSRNMNILGSDSQSFTLGEGTSMDNTLHIQASPSHTLSINGGTLGSGTFQVNGDIKFQGNLYLRNNAYLINAYQNNNALQPNESGSSNTGVEIYNSTGSVYSNLEVDGSSNAAGFRLSYNSTNSATNTMLSLTNKGVGINTAEPDYAPALPSTSPMLDVKGDIRAYNVVPLVRSEIRRGIYECRDNGGNPLECKGYETIDPPFSAAIKEVNCNVTTYGELGTKKPFVSRVFPPSGVLGWRVEFGLGDSIGGKADISYICFGK